MNDSLFNCYDQLFCSSSAQSNEIGAILQQEHDSLYYNGQALVSDVTTTQQTQALTVAGNHIGVGSSTGGYTHNAHANIPFVQIHTTDVQPQRNYGNVFRRTITTSSQVIKSEPIKSESAESGKERANATPTPPVRNNSCNSSEQRIATPSLNQNDGSSQGSTILAEPDVAVVATNAATQKTPPNTQSFETLSVHQCSQCRFLCLEEISLENHVAAMHNQTSFTLQAVNNEQRISCPGCPNIFYNLKSFEVHLLEDHLVSLSDCNKMTETLRNKNHAKDTNDNDKVPAEQQQQRKSRIYLKNVECLREPHREPMDINGPANVHINENDFYPSKNVDLSEILLSGGDFNTTLNNEAQAENSTAAAAAALDGCHSQANQLSSNAVAKPKQKISIKSVDVLREPALLRRDFELQCNQFVTNEHQHQYNDAFNVYQSPTNNNGLTNCGGVVDNLSNANFTTANVSNLNGMAAPVPSPLTELEKPRRPKIYIKNVDILKEPIMLPNFDNNLLPLPPPPPISLSSDANAANLIGYNYLSPDFMSNNTGNLATTTNVEFDANGNSHQHQIPTEHYLYDSPTLSANNMNHNHINGSIGSTVNDINLLSSVEGFTTFNNNGNDGNNVNTTYLQYPQMMTDCDGLESVSTLSSSTTPIMTEPTPPPAPPPLPATMPPITAYSTSSSPPVSLANTTTANALTTSATTLQTTPTQQQQKQKIFIKNVDILKEPQFQVQQRERGTLHLRTVDELNLMNRNEVESLIAPNLEHSSANNATSLQTANVAHNAAAIEDENDESALTTTDHNHHHPHHHHHNQHDDIMFCQEDALKLQDYAAQLVNSWTTDDYDLGNDIDCIITDAMPETMNMLPLPQTSQQLPPPPPVTNAFMPTTKLNHDLDMDTPQMSLISIRDIEELTGRNNLQNAASSSSSALTEMLDTNNFEIKEPCVVNNRIATVDVQDKPANDSIADIPAPFHFNINVESPPPLAPVTTITTTISTNNNNETSKILTTPTSTTPPPLVPVSPYNVSNNNNNNNNSSKSTKRGRIYVANNLVHTPLTTSSNAKENPTTCSNVKENPTTCSNVKQNPTTCSNVKDNPTTCSNVKENPTTSTCSNVKDNPIAETSTSSSSSSTKNRKLPTVVSVTGGTSVQGRPFGSNRVFSAAKLNKPRAETNDVVVKCSVRNCAFRFKKPETLTYHQRCHDSTKQNSWQAKVCPECNLKDFSNWNTLHTHLWRTHKIDMELYSCTICQFKTPIYSRLVNTHTKIHSEERNYKCESCGKGFKNTKQLKNHRRWHRVASNHAAAAAKSTATTTMTPVTMATTTTTAAIAADPPPSTTTTTSSTTLTTTSTMDSELILELHRCHDCGSAFSHSKTLREHNCKKKSDHQLSCSVCGHVASSKSALKLHMFTHENAKRLKCAHCTYSTSDHNAFRRHKMTHENAVMYECPHCSYKSIQSAAFQKHVLAKHPEKAAELIHKCKICTYSTVSRSLFALHQKKH